MSDEDYRELERRTSSAGTPAYQAFDPSFVDEDLDEREEYEQVVEDFQGFYDWRQNSGILGSVRSAVSDVSGGDYIDVNGVLDNPDYGDVFTAVYLADVDGKEDLEDLGLENGLGGYDVDRFLSGRDKGLAIVSEGGAMMNVERRGGEHWFNWHDTELEDGEKLAHEVFAEYMEHLMNEQYPWREA